MSKRQASRYLPVMSAKKKGTPETGHVQHRFYTDRRYHKMLVAEKGTAICSSCQAISSGKHWFIDRERLKLLAKDKSVLRVLCPGCSRIEQKIYEGEVVIKSSQLAKIKDDLYALIRHTEGKAWHDNPRSRIATILETKGQVEIKTTTKWLAARIGKEVNKSFKGELEIKPSPREKYVRVHWSEGNDEVKSLSRKRS